MKKPELRIFSNLARTGGTLVSRCIGCMDQVALLSEVHPFGIRVANNNVLAQAFQWYRLFEPEQFQDKSYSFNEVIGLIVDAMIEKNLQLVIRDWAHLDFIAVPFLDKPHYHSRLVELLENDFNIIQFHLVRHPVPQWYSTYRLRGVYGKLSLEQFLEGYYRYALLCVENNYIRYEDFCRDTERCMQILCDNLQINYDSGFMEKWSAYTNVTGDKHGKDNKPKYDYIKPVEFPMIDASFYKQLHDCEYYSKSLELLGYDDVQVK